MNARELLAQATPRPWRLENDVEDGTHTLWMLQDGETRGAYGPEHRLEWNHGLYPGECDEQTWGDGEQYDEADANAALIVAAVNAYEALLDVAEAAEKVNEGRDWEQPARYIDFVGVLDGLTEALARLDGIRGHHNGDTT